MDTSKKETTSQGQNANASCSDKSFHAGPRESLNLESQLNTSKGGGSRLPHDVKSFMEPRFGTDFSNVMVHTSSEAVRMNRDLNAQAFTHQQDIYFGDGKSAGKDSSLPYELTHVVQNTGGIKAKYVSGHSTVQLKAFSLRGCTSATIA